MNRPYLDFYLDVGFLSIRTDLMHVALNEDSYVYIRLSWRFFKWEGGFKLYEPGRERRRRLSGQP